MTAFESLKNRVNLIVSGAASFIAVIGAIRLATREPLARRQADAVVGVALVRLFRSVKDRRGGAR